MAGVAGGLAAAGRPALPRALFERMAFPAGRRAARHGRRALQERNCRSYLALAPVWAVGFSSSERFQWARLAPASYVLWQKSSRDCSGELESRTSSYIRKNSLFT